MSFVSAVNFSLFFSIIWIAFMIVGPICIVCAIVEIIKLIKKVKANKK